MIIYGVEHIKGDLFRGDERVIAHGCNCIGMMGAGVAKVIRDRFPLVFRKYQAAVDAKVFNLGYAQFVRDAENNICVYNLATQRNPGKDGSYWGCYLAFCNMLEHAKVNNVTRIAMPRIGGGIAGLMWKDLNGEQCVLDCLAVAREHTGTTESIEIVVYVTPEEWWTLTDDDMPPDRITVYTDGASSPDGAGGWAWVVSERQKDSGAAADTTNNRMELMAVIEAIEAFGPNVPLTIVSDSKYVVDCLNQRWYVKWRKNGWKNVQKEPVANPDLWERLLKAVEAHPDLKVEWVKGHSGDPLNDLADRLAVRAKEEGRDLRQGVGQ